MKVMVSKWGNSLALRLPKTLANAHHLAEGSAVEISKRGNSLLITPASSEPSLEDMLKQITPANLHASIDSGDALGKEAW